METKAGRIFVFGSNEAGVHGAGSALHALNHFGAKMGVGVGRMGDSYAIPTKDESVREPLPLKDVAAYVEVFKNYARRHPELLFIVVKIGCGLAGFKEDEIKPMFMDAPENCIFPKEWER